jgi:hypothetical protein
MSGWRDSDPDPGPDLWGCLCRGFRLGIRRDFGRPLANPVQVVRRVDRVDRVDIYCFQLKSGQTMPTDLGVVVRQKVVHEIGLKLARALLSRRIEVGDPTGGGGEEKPF